MMESSTDSTCKFYVVRKNRFCRMTVKNGHDYCGEHEPIKNTEELADKVERKRGRIPCPLDSKHTVFAYKLDQHLKVCNARQGITPGYLKTKINTETNIESPAVKITTDRQLSKTPIIQIQNAIAKIRNIFNRYIQGTVKEEILEHEVLSEELANPEYGFKTRKHLLQTSSMLGHLKKENLILNDTSYIEFGAGKGKLSYWTAKATSDFSNTNVLLVDRDSHRHKMDNKLKLNDSNYENRVHRIRADIIHLDLSNLEIISKTKHIVGLAKHLCGSATDFALRCLHNCYQINQLVNGVLMAFCCHHRCLWNDYVGKAFLMNNGISPEEFDILCGIVSWAVCGAGMSREKRKELNEQTDDSKKEKSRNEELGLNREEKADIGKMAKRVLDFGRLEYLRSLGFKCKLVYYVSSEVSLENVCLIASKT